MVVDDDLMVLSSTGMMLDHLGYQAIEMESGFEAIRTLEAGAKVDLLITDYRMPGMTGGEVAAIVRQRWPTLPVIISSGYIDVPGDGRLTLPRLTKPFTLRQLLDTITEVFAVR